MDLEAAKFEFEDTLYASWLPSFCDARAADFQPDGFVAASLKKLGAFDAYWFLRANKLGLVFDEGGFFKSKNVRTGGQIFWSGRKGQEIRSTTLWIEPVITIGAIARLVEEFKWPPSQITTQTKFPWPFDLICEAEDAAADIIACEVKKTESEVQDLIRLMSEYSHTVLDDEALKGKHKNAYRKVVGLRASSAKLLWVLGPNDTRKQFKVRRGDDGIGIELVLTSSNSLMFEAGNDP